MRAESLREKLRRYGVTSERAALACFVAYVVAAYPAILFYFGKDEWFFHNDWYFIVGQDLTSVFTPVEQHWSTIPILIYRLFYRSFGANYFPFLATVSALHLGVVSLLRVLMRRAGVGPWLASVTAAELVLFAPGYLSILFAIQITQNLSLVFGLGQMILADHDGKLDRRDWLGLGAGVLGLMSSGLTPILVIAVGLSTSIRRGLRAALFHTAPLGAVYVVWFWSTKSLQSADLFRLPYGESRPAAFLVEGIVQAATGFARSPWLALGLAAIAAGGLGLRLRDEGLRARPSLSMPAAMLACVPIYFGILGLQRSRLGIGYMGWAHHLYNGACFFLPALALGIEAWAKRWKALGGVLTLGLAAFIPLNAWNFRANESRNWFLSTSFIQQNRFQILAIAHSPLATEALHVDRSKLVTDPWYGHEVFLGWAIDEAKAGRLPHPGPVDAAENDFLELFYGLTDLGAPAPGSACDEEVTSPLEIRPNPGDTISTGSAVLVFNVRTEHAMSVKFTNAYNPGAGHVLRVELPDLRLKLAPVPGAQSFVYCHGSPRPLVAAESVKPSAAALKKAIDQDPAAKEELKKAIQADPAAMEALRKAIQRDPAAMEALRKAMAAGSGQ